MTEHGQISANQYETLMRPLNGTRIAKRSQGGKQLSYLESWDVKAHLTRVFGFGNWDLQMLDYQFVTAREYQSSGDNPKPMVEVIYSARMQLTIRDEQGREVCRHSEAAVGSASGPASMLGEHHDNAVKQAASDALKRCAINLGSQFGLSLYDNGSTREVIKATIVKPEGVAEKEQATPEQAAALASSVGAQQDPVEATREQVERIKDAKAEAQAAVSGNASDEAARQVEGEGIALASARKRMFALMNDAKFSTGDEGRTERLGYCASVLDRPVESSSDLTLEEVRKVNDALVVLIGSERAEKVTA